MKAWYTEIRSRLFPSLACRVRIKMPIPDLDENGLLPAGIHDCTVQEMEERFGRVRVNSHRHELFAKLQAYIEELRASSLALYVVVDGSFATEKARPNDIDIIAVLKEEHDMSASLRPFEYNLLAPRRVNKRFALDFRAVRENSEEFHEYLIL